MRKTLAILRKELVIYFATPPAYFFWALTITICSLWFYVANVQRVGEASLRYVIDIMVTAMLFLAPVVTMRLIAEERSAGTVELLLTSPLSEMQIVLGKFLAALAVFAVLLGLSLVYPAVLFWRGSPGPDLGVLASQYLGLLLVAGAASSVGLFFSALTDSQVVAAISGFLAVFAMVLLRAASVALPAGLADLIRELTFLDHLQNFSRGVVDGTDLYYFLAWTGLFLFLTGRALESRRWARV